MIQKQLKVEKQISVSNIYLQVYVWLTVFTENIFYVSRVYWTQQITYIYKKHWCKSAMEPFSESI